ncbi:hypothetical protein FBU59_002405 [Linderina macrospora]|uniref:Uncharacterized protein n=1 Tax=Linderina macrospora TaxID=4868 RepID=A0ACC1JBK7_9FUNG|nr:hypothetical protein FBU59_002405 [Linderina macrospora]
MKFFTGLVAAAAIAQGAFAHMGVIAPKPRSGVVADELLAPCGGGNTLTKNVTTAAVGTSTLFSLKPGHGQGTLIFNYFTDLTVTNDTKATLLQQVDIPTPGIYNTTIDFSKHGLKAGQNIVVQAVYDMTEGSDNEKFYVCFDVAVADSASASADAEPSSEGGAESGLDKSSAAKPKSTTGSASTLTVAVGSAVFMLLAAAF